jgi:hypothetical protein
MAIPETHALPVGTYEFTDAGGLIPWARNLLEWPDNILEREGWEPTGFVGGGLGDSVTAEIYSHPDTGRTLVELEAYGVAVAILCRTRPAFLRLVRDWLRPLMELNPKEKHPRFGPSSERSEFDRASITQ